MRLLLDTHIVLWGLYDSGQLSEPLKAFLQRGDVRLEVSVASLWEAAIKSAKGRLPLARETFPADMIDAGISMLPVEAKHAWRVRELDMVHRDPFDRLLVAQALVEDITLVTDDRTLANYGARVMLA